MSAKAPAARVRQKTIRKILLVALVAVLAGGWVLRESILRGLGQALVRSEAPQKADAMVVLGGDWRGSRILKAAELAREGYAPRVLVSGVRGMYGNSEADLAIEFAVRHGAPREIFTAARGDVVSTAGEAEEDVGILRRMGVHSYLLVTSDYHTRRAGRNFARLAPEMEMRTVASGDPVWNGGEWWRTREGRKTWLLEMSKTVADTFGM